MYKVECVSGGLQNGKLDSPLEPFIIIVKDENDEPVPYVPVEFRIAEGKGRFDYNDPRTDQTGSAVAEFVPEGPGRFRVECFVGEDGRESIPFKGVVEGPEPPKAKKPRRTKRPSRAAVPPVVGLTPVPPIPGPPPLPAEAIPEVPPLVPDLQPSPPAPVAAPAPAPVVQAEPKPEAPKAPTATVLPTTPKPAPAPVARVASATAVIRRPAPAPARAAAPVRAQSDLRPKRKKAAPKTKVSPVLIAVVAVIYLLLAPLAGAMVAADLSTPRPVVDCSRGAWHLDGDIMVFRGCVHSAR